MLQDAATRSKTHLREAGEDHVARDDFRTREELDPDSYAGMLAAHWAQHTPDKYKFSFNENVLAHMRPHSREPVPNYSVGTRGLPFINQLPSEGARRGNGLY